MRKVGFILVCAGAIASGAGASEYKAGFVWNRVADWTPGRKNFAGYQFGNPAPDQKGGPAWAYEYVFSGGDLGDAHPWFEGTPAPLVWDPDWFGIGVGLWAKTNDLSPPIWQPNITHVISTQDEFERVPMVRWMNPTGAGCTVRITGDLTLHWTGVQNLATVVDASAAIVAVAPDGTYTRLLAEVYADPSPGDQNIGVKTVPINLNGVQVPIGGAILISVRGSKAVPGRWFDMDDKLTITLESIEGGCAPDLDGNGKLDLFDFLAFVNLFNAGC